MTMMIAMPAPRLPQAAAADRVAGAGLPDLPQLTRLLARGRALPDASDWRAGVLAGLGGAAAGLAPVAVASWALQSMPRDTALCFATPVHALAGINRVHLAPLGQLPMDAGEEELWCTDFNEEFGSETIRLHQVAPGGGWLLQAPFAQGARDASPEMLAGVPLARQPARDDDERLLRRLGTEVEMWLAAHALNRAREARHLPAFNALWFWGGAVPVQAPALAFPRRIFATGTADAWLAGLARQAGVAVAPAACWSDVAAELAPAAAAGATSGLIVLAPGHAAGPRGSWEAAEADWFAPVARALELGELFSLRLQIGARAWQVPDRSLRRWFRPVRRSWWQLAGEAPP